MDRELIILGTGYALAVECYNTCFAIRNGSEYMLVDAGGGNGILKQCKDAGISFRDVRSMFLTHGHTDHLLGAIWVVRKIATLMVTGKYDGEFTIFCHKELRDTLDLFCRMTLNSYHYDLIGKRILYQENADGRDFRISGMRITPFDILSDKKKQFGFRAEFQDGYVLVCLGDEPYNRACRKYVEGADLLMSESFCLYEDRERFRPYEKHHATVKDAAEVAAETGARTLLIYHTEDTDIKGRREKYSAEAEKYFSGKVIVPEDLDLVSLTK